MNSRISYSHVHHSEVMITNIQKNYLKGQKGVFVLLSYIILYLSLSEYLYYLSSNHISFTINSYLKKKIDDSTDVVLSCEISIARILNN